MSTFISFVHKEFIHIIRDGRTTLIVLIMPIILTLIFGYAISTEIHDLRVVAVVAKQTEDIRRQLASLDANSRFDYGGIIAADRIDEVLRRGDADAVIVYDRDGNTQIVVDASDATMAATATNYIRMALAEGSNSLSGSNSSSGSMVVTILRYNPQMKSAYMYVPGIMGMIFILICALMTSVSIVREKETGTMEVLLVSPLRPWVIIVAKLIPYFVISCIILVSILCLVHFAMGVPLISLGGIILLTVQYILLSLSLGLLISTIAEKQIIALLISAMVMMLPVIMLSGMIFPVENLPVFLRPLSYIVPAYWFNDAIRQLMVEGVPFIVVWKQFAVILGMTIVVMTVAMKKFNDRLE